MCGLLDEDALVFLLLLVILKKCRNMQKIRNENQRQVKKIEGEGGVDLARVRKENEKSCGYGREKKEDERI